jgi:RNA polymerase sigma factor (sigma-70 family)
MQTNSTPRPLSPEAERIARRYAAKVSRHLPPRMDRGDFVSIALLAAWNAEGKFDPNRGATLHTWVRGCVWGALREYLRQEDHLTRGQRARKNAGEVLPAHCDEPLSLDDPTHHGHFIAYGDDTLTFAEAIRDPVEAVGRDGLTESLRGEDLRTCVARLKPRLRRMLALYYWQDETGKEVARAMGLSESRIHQFRAQALAELREVVTP